MFEDCTLEKIKSIKEKIASIKQESKDWKYCGKWLRCGVINYTDPFGKKQTYETVERTTRSDVIGVDGVDIITLIPPATTRGARGCGAEKICLVAVYRPPVNRYSIEFPSGLINPGESLQEAAQRELAEETGCTSKIKSVGPAVYSDPWKSNENTAVCIAEATASIDSSALQLDHDEFIDPLELPLIDLKKQLDILQSEHGFIVDAKLYCFAMGLEMQPQCT